MTVTCIDLHNKPKAAVYPGRYADGPGERASMSTSEDTRTSTMIQWLLKDKVQGIRKEALVVQSEYFALVCL
jgi:hypothetical protein